MGKGSHRDKVLRNPEFKVFSVQEVVLRGPQVFWGQPSATTHPTRVHSAQNMLTDTIDALFSHMGRPMTPRLLTAHFGLATRF